MIGLPSSSSAKASPSPEFIPNSSKPLSSTVQTTAIAPFASPSEGESSSDSVPKQNSKQKPIKRIPVPQWNLSSLSLGGNKDSSSTPTTPSSTISYPPPPIPPPSRPPRSPARPSILLPPTPISSQGFSHLNTPSASTSLSNTTCVLSPTSPCKQQFEDASESPSEPSQPSSVEPQIPVFGPERVVLDPRIKKVHAKILRDMFLVGLVWGIIFTAVVCSVPGG